MKLLLLLSEFFLFERIGVLYAMTPLVQNSHDVLIKQPQGMPYNKLLEMIEEYDPDVIGYSVASGEHNYFMSLNARLKKDVDFVSFFGGPHPTFFPEMIHEPGVDAINVGEGEESCLEFMNALAEGGDLTNIPNIWFKTPDGQVHENRPRPLIMDLDTLPFPDRSLLYDCDVKLGKFYMKSFFASRGCPRRCSFCYNHMVKDLYPGQGGKLRYRSPRNFVDEILQVKKEYPLGFVAIGDDNFLFKPKAWIEEFAEIYTREVGLPYSCSVSAHFVRPDLMQILKDSGCYTVNVAFECADDFVNNKILSKGVTRKQFTDAIKMVKSYGIVAKAMNIVGLPVEDPIKVDLETLDVNIECRPDAVNATLLAPFPKLQVTEYCRENGYLPDDDSIYEEFKTNILDKAQLDYGDETINRKLERLQKLFPLVVEFPWLRPFVDKLIDLPIYTPVKYLNILFYAYVTHIRIVKNVSFMSFADLAVSFFKYLVFREKY